MLDVIGVPSDFSHFTSSSWVVRPVIVHDSSASVPDCCSFPDGLTSEGIEKISGIENISGIAEFHLDPISKFIQIYLKRFHGTNENKLVKLLPRVRTVAVTSCSATGDDSG